MLVELYLGESVLRLASLKVKPLTVLWLWLPGAILIDFSASCGNHAGIGSISGRWWLSERTITVVAQWPRLVPEGWRIPGKIDRWSRGNTEVVVLGRIRIDFILNESKECIPQVEYFIKLWYNAIMCILINNAAFQYKVPDLVLHTSRWQWNGYPTELCGFRIHQNQ